MTQFERRKGRILTIDKVKWKWLCSRRGTFLAYSDNGLRVCERAATLKGLHPVDFIEGQWNRSFDGSLTPKDVASWLTKVQRSRVGTEPV